MANAIAPGSWERAAPGQLDLPSPSSDGIGDQNGGDTCPTCGQLGGCRITCPLADHPHPTQRKRIARADHRDSYRWVSVRGVRGRCTEERRGTSEGSARARARANALTFCCPLCTHLVDINAASKSARKQGRRTLKAGDGCLRCGPHYRPSKFASAQRSKIEGLLQGKRVLVARPEHIGEDAPMTMLSSAEAAHRVARAQLEFPPPFHARDREHQTAEHSPLP